MGLPIARVAAGVSALGMAATLAAWAPPVSAAQSSGRFEVVINLQPGTSAPASGLCRSSNYPGGFGATVTVVCSTGAVVDISSGESGMPWVPMHGGAYRYLFQIRKGDDLLGTVDSYTGAGTVTSWRVVRMTNWEYIELTVGW